MVKIAIAGGTGSTIPMLKVLYCSANHELGVAREIIDVLAASKKHDILVLSRKVHPYHNATRVAADDLLRALRRIASR